MTGSGRLIAFEGVDGAGKSTVLSRVAEHLRARGERVFLPRLGKEHDSRPTRMIRRLTRDQRNLELSARAELLLYCAREAQILEELVRPALARGETVLMDRSLLTPEVLGRARGLDNNSCAEAVGVAAIGLEPDLTLVFDVHPRTSRIRKRIERVRTHSLAEEGGRKGLAGSAFKERVRELYVSLARERGYPLFHVERATPAELETRVITALDRGVHADLGQTDADHMPQWRVPEEVSFAEGLNHLPLPIGLFIANGLIAGRALREKAVADEAELAAWSLDLEDPLREQLFEREPEYVLRGQRRRPLEDRGDIRMRALVRSPEAALSALRYQQTPELDKLRAEYVDSHPNGVLRSIAGREDAVAEELRSAAWKQADDIARASSISGCVSQSAWKRREALFEKHPALAIGTLSGVCDPRGDRWLSRYASYAPKRVLGALTRRADPFAHELRDMLFETGREVIGSLRHLDDPYAWQLRERALLRWPSTVAQSLLGLPPSDALASMAARCAVQAKGDMHVLRRLQALREWPLRPTWAMSSIADEDALDPASD